MKRNTLLGIVLLPASLLAQGLHQDIDLKHEIVPIPREATKLGITAPIRLDHIPNVRLALSERAVATDVPPEISFLQPAAYADTLYTSPYLGYAALAVSPYPYDAMASAGYRFLDTDRVRLSGWLQYDTRNYKRQIPFGADDDLHFLRNQTVSAGVDFRWAAGKESYFKTAIDYTFDRYNTYYKNSPVYIDNIGGATPATRAVSPDERPIILRDHYWETLNLLNVDMKWYSNEGGLNYNVGLRYNHAAMVTPGLKFPKPFWDVSNPRRENTVQVTGQAVLPFSERSEIGLDLDADFVRLSTFSEIVYEDDDYATYSHDGETRGLLDFTPYYKFSTDHFNARLGARLGLSFKSGKAFHVAPDVVLGWNPTSTFGVSAHVTGGVKTNSLEELYGVTPYLNPTVAYGFSNVPLASELRVIVGPFRSAYVQLYGGYSIARDWLMPTFLAGKYLERTALFAPVDMKGYHLGLMAGYTYRRLAEISASYTYAPSKYDRGYYLWRDRATHVFEVNLGVHPLKGLDLEASYSLRTGRHIFDRYTVSTDMGYSEVSVVYNLRNRSELNVGATYRLFEPLTLFVRGENLLNRNSTDISLRPDEGLRVLLGASYLF